MRKTKQIVILCVLIGCAYGSIIYLQPSQVKIENSTENEKCLVYQSLLQTIMAEQNNGQIVINNITNINKELEANFKVEDKLRNKILYTIEKVLPENANNLITNKIINIADDLPTLLPETLNSFKNANKTSQNLNLTCCTINYKFISEEDRQAILNQEKLKDSLKAFYQKYPHGYIVISNIGFDSTKKQALVYISYNGVLISSIDFTSTKDQIFSFIGNEEIFLFSKDRERWVLKYRKHPSHSDD